VVRPKTPRGDGNSRRGMARQAWLGGRQTQNPERGRKLHIDFLDLARREDHVVRPKTPREDGNSSTIASMSMSQSSSRQTQNPERGRKLDGTELSGFYQVVVRPKTPRGDGNYDDWVATASVDRHSG
ncbi:hypothetical protein, partial [Mycobacterium tuberculosis]|uniref:hypothetical protein n=1 Tax=Mycobacterium tuberculosis TaxID=1773 RepID=UPI003F491A89